MTPDKDSRPSNGSFPRRADPRPPSLGATVPPPYLRPVDGASRPEDLRQSGLRWWENEHFAIGWKGHLYLPGEAAGAPSVARIAATLEGEGADFADVAARVAGVFGLFAHDKRRGGWQVAVDNAGLYRVFHDSQSASTSFLELVRARGTGRADLDLAALVEYLTQGQVLGPRTFVAGIDKLPGREILELPDDGSPARRRAKPLPDVVPGGTATVLERFAALARSLEGRALSVDATGGFDSRLILCLLDDDGLPFELATSGRPGTSDTEVTRTVARLLGRPLHLTGHDLRDLDAELVLTFRAGDGVTDLRRFHRDRQHALARLARGVEVIAHGGGSSTATTASSRTSRSTAAGVPTSNATTTCGSPRWRSRPPSSPWPAGSCWPA
jgi:hypothetical protein